MSNFLKQGTWYDIHLEHQTLIGMKAPFLKKKCNICFNLSFLFGLPSHVCCRGTKNRSLYAKFRKQKALRKGEFFVFWTYYQLQYIYIWRCVFNPHRTCSCSPKWTPVWMSIELFCDQKRKTSLKWPPSPAEVNFSFEKPPHFRLQLFIYRAVSVRDSRFDVRPRKQVC